MNSFTTRDLQEPNLIPHTERIQEEKPQQEQPKRRKSCSCFLIALILIIIGVTVIIGRANNSFFVGVKSGFLGRQISHIFGNDENKLKGEIEGRINFLLLGIGGAGHDGPYLTDTIILASLKPSTKEAAMISLPRDLIIPSGDGYYSKINHVYAVNQSKGLDYAFDKTKELVGNAFGLDIHYLGVIDFRGFIEVVDAIGTITVDVETSFTDRQFPTADYRIQEVSFDAGVQKMDGLTALRFARSRHGNNGEGSDFARSKRQQKIILALKEKLTSFNTLFNPKKIVSLYDLVNEYTKTDIEPWEAVKLIHLTRDIDPAYIYNAILDDSPGGYLSSGISSLDGAYILQPVSGSFDQLQKLAATVFNSSQIAAEKPTLLILNGTDVPGAAALMANNLRLFGLKIIGTGNAETTGYTKTIIYDYTNGEKPLARDFMKQRLNADVKTDAPLKLLNSNLVREMELTDQDGNYHELDFLVVLGEDITRAESHEIIPTLTPEELAQSTTTDELLDDSEDATEQVDNPE